jgi:hypothetical protein
VSGGEGEGFGAELLGRSFQVPTPAVALRPEDRLALAVFTSGGTVRGGRELRYDLAPGAVDLGLARTGRAPLLEEHLHSLDALIGAVVAADVGRDLLRVVVRFAEGGRAERWWSMLEQGFPLSMSLGATIVHAVEDGADAAGLPAYRATRWALREVSVVTFGADQAAHMRRFGDDEAEAVLREMRGRAGDERRAAVARALHLDRWREGWPVAAGLRLAGRFGLDGGEVAVALDEEVRRHCDALERDLAA